MHFVLYSVKISLALPSSFISCFKDIDLLVYSASKLRKPDVQTSYM